MQRSEIEIMAPVGSYEALAAAIQAGADSVYFGVGKLNMRSASAANFTLDDLAKIVATSATIGGALPNSGAMFGMLAAMGLNHKNSYKHIAAISNGAGLCALIVMILMATVGIV